MALTVPNEGEGRMLRLITNNVAGEDLTLKLFTNNITPAETDTVLTYTEAAGDGYAAVPMAGANWTFTEGDPSHADYVQQTFTFLGGGISYYGYMVVSAVANKLMWAERFVGAPYVSNNNGDQIKVTPRFELA